MKTFFKKYKHAWVFTYFLIYLPWFYYLEQTVTTNYNLIEVTLDKQIPFIEYFIVPYLLWFPFVAVTVLYFFFKDKKEFYQLALLMAIGMTLFLIISTMWPNGQALRPKFFERDNIFVDMVKTLYKTDTPTNIFPSIHVYNTLACFIAIRKSVHLKNIRWVQSVNWILSVSIILSTVFLKQHSILDGIAAGVFILVSYVFIYADEYKNAHEFKRLPI